MLIFIIAFIRIMIEILVKTIGQVEPDPSDVQPEPSNPEEPQPETE
jgi:hypothetical protein